MHEVVQLAIVAFFGLAAGSFINAYVWRVHNKLLQEETGAKTQAVSSPSSVFNGRSMCPDCGHQLSAKDLIPVFSWIKLGGNCRYCNNKISIQYPVVEITTAIIFLFSAWWWPFGIEGSVSASIFIVWLVIVTQFIALALYDIKWYLLPDRMVAGLLASTVVLRLLEAASGLSMDHWLVNPLIGAATAFAIFYGLFALGKGKWMGGGDVKLVFVLGLLLGLSKTLLAMFLAFNIAALFSLSLIVLGQKAKSDKVQFGPFLLLGAWISVLFGSEIIAWYLGLSF